jgi:hypothetical protein
LAARTQERRLTSRTFMKFCGVTSARATVDYGRQ